MYSRFHLEIKGDTLFLFIGKIGLSMMLLVCDNIIQSRKCTFMSWKT
jgi:hypothetical protein